ncbi:MAG: hypothetical protein ACKO28_09195 [Cyanobium sp.]
MTKIPLPDPSHRSLMLDGLGLGLLSTSLAAFAIWSTLTAQTIAQQPALQGVMAFHLSRTGGLRLWNQPILAQDLPMLLKRAHARSTPGKRIVVRLVPDPEVPWGAIHRMLTRLQPNRQDRNWVLQLQMP